MSQAFRQYWHELSSGFASAWNRFWFRPSHPATAAVLRIGVGILAVYFVASHSLDLVRWFGPNGLLPIDAVKDLTGGGTPLDGVPVRDASFHLSYLNLVDHPLLLWIAHLVGLAVVLMFTAGFLTRWTNLASVLVVLSYVHRAPMITGQFEPVLTMALLYLCITPAGCRWSVDRWLGRTPAVESSWTATVGLRLLQVHLAMFYVMMALNKLGGETWWTGEAGWWLMAHSESRLVDLTFLHKSPLVFQAWTHAIVLFELTFPLLAWNRLARPLMLVIGVLVWSSLALVTGLVPFCLLMIVVNLAYVPGECWTRGGGQPASEGQAAAHGQAV